MLEWHRLAANCKVRRMAASIPNTAPVVHFTLSRSRYQFILLGEQRHTCVNNLPRVAPSGGTAGNRTRNLSITNPTPYCYTTKPQQAISWESNGHLMDDGTNMWVITSAFLSLVSHKQYKIECWFQWTIGPPMQTTYCESNGRMTDDVTWPCCPNIKN